MKDLKRIAALLLAGGALVAPLSHASVRRVRASEAADPYAYLASLPAFEGRDVTAEFRFVRALDVAYGTVYRFRAESGDIAVAVGKDGNVLSLANYLRESAAAARSDAPARFRQTAEVELRGVPTALDLDFVPSEIRPESGTYYLADYARNILTFRDLRADRLYSSARADGFEETALTLFANMVRAYDFYTEKNIGADRRGINGENDDVWGNADARGEIPLYIYPHLNSISSLDDNRYNAAFDYNAEENIAYIVVGDGGEEGPLLGQGNALDILAHEYQHGITMFTADLGHENAAGALNESISDIFGALVEGHALTEDAFWEMGEDGIPAGSPVVRSMNHPAAGYATTVSEAFPECHLAGSHASHGNCDSGGVHFNSTIATNMQYRLFERMPEFFTRERIGKLWYATLCMLPSDAGFSDFGHEFLQAAIDLRFDHTVQTAIREELTASGLLGEETLHTVTFLSENGEEEHTLAFDGAPLPLADPAAREGYTFAGWYLDAACTQRAEGAVTGDTLLYARWIPLAEEDGPSTGGDGEEDPAEDGKDGKKPLPAWAIGVICAGSVAVMGAAAAVIVVIKRRAS